MLVNCAETRKGGAGVPPTDFDVSIHTLKTAHPGFFGQLVSNDPTIAIHWLRLAVSVGNHFALEALSVCYIIGRGVPVDIRYGCSLLAPSSPVPGWYYNVMPLIRFNNHVESICGTTSAHLYTMCEYISDNLRSGPYSHSPDFFCSKQVERELILRGVWVGEDSPMGSCTETDTISPIKDPPKVPLVQELDHDDDED